VLVRHRSTTGRREVNTKAGIRAGTNDTLTNLPPARSTGGIMKKNHVWIIEVELAWGEWIPWYGESCATKKLAHKALLSLKQIHFMKFRIKKYVGV
jgi:hypothetical protein